MQKYYRKKLDKLLSEARDEEYIQLLWATHILQTDTPDPARMYIRAETIPDGAIGAKIFEKLSIHPWEIETLANELMTVTKARPNKYGVVRTVRCDHFGNLISSVNWLRKLENSEYRILKVQQNVLIETGRIAARQFNFQRGFANQAQFYRNAFVYGQGPCSSYFKENNDITLNRFSQIGFMLFTSLNNFPVVRKNSSWEEIGVAWEEVEKVLALIALPFSKAASLAHDKRRNTIHTSDKASILRQAPCLRFGKNGERIRAPLPELIIERITSGIFYDVVGGGGHIRDDYGKRFEDYCMDYLSSILSSFDWEREFSYRKKRDRFESPDILCTRNGEISIAFECKATRMSHEAMFGINPIEARGYEDIVKATFQLWRFFSHCRRGYIDRAVDIEAVGVVLTLDNWLVMSETLVNQVLTSAEKLASEKDSEILKVDMKSIVFVAIVDLEETLSTSTETTFLQALRLSNTPKYSCWRLDGIHNDLTADMITPNREYLYADELGKLLPWWDQII